MFSLWMAVSESLAFMLVRAVCPVLFRRYTADNGSSVVILVLSVYWPQRSSLSKV